MIILYFCPRRHYESYKRVSTAKGHNQLIFVLNFRDDGVSELLDLLETTLMNLFINNRNSIYPQLNMSAFCTKC